MLPSPATERTKSKNIPLDLQLTSCEAQRDLVFARAREPLNQRNHRRGSPNRHFETPHAPLAEPRTTEPSDQKVRAVSPPTATVERRDRPGGFIHEYNLAA